MNSHVTDQNNNHRDRASHCRDVRILHISLKQTFKFNTPKPILNKLGLPVKKIYRTADVCKILGIKPDTFRARLRWGIYEDKFMRDKVGRLFTLQDIEELKR
jgi:hypothetical protein